MKFLKEEAALLKEPSGSTFILLMSDWSRDIFRVCWHLRDVRRGAVGRATSGVERALLAPRAERLINLEDRTNPPSDLESGKNIPIEARAGVESYKMG